MATAKRKSRYANIKRHQADGYTFDSKREMLRYFDLKLMLLAHEIEELEVHPRIKITIGGVEVKYPSGRHLSYIADFRYYDCRTKSVVVEDCKMQSGHRTEVYKIKRALLQAMGIRILET
jgi:hypothetical protein